MSGGAITLGSWTGGNPVIDASWPSSATTWSVRFRVVGVAIVGSPNATIYAVCV